MLGVAEAIETSASQNESVGLAFRPLAQPRVDVAAHLDEADVWAQGEDHGLAAGTGGGDSGVRGKHVQAPVFLADESIASVDARRDGGEGEARVKGRWEIFERVDGEVDAADKESVFDLFDEDAFGLEGSAVLEGGGGDEAGVLHAVADGADDLDFYRVAVAAELRGDVVGLPQGKLRAAGSNSNRVCVHIG